MIGRLAFAVLTGIIAFISFSILIKVLVMVNLGEFAAIVDPFVFWIAVLLGILAFFGYRREFWANWKTWFN